MTYSLSQHHHPSKLVFIYWDCVHFYLKTAAFIRTSNSKFPSKPLSSLTIRIHIHIPRRQANCLLLYTSLYYLQPRLKHCKMFGFLADLVSKICIGRGSSLEYSIQHFWLINSRPQEDPSQQRIEEDILAKIKDQSVEHHNSVSY